MLLLSHISQIQNKQLIWKQPNQYMEDSLEVSKFSAKRKSVSPSAKEDKQRGLLQQVKQKFITALLKLQSSQTRQIAIQEIRTIVDQNQQPDHLRLYLSVMKSLKIEGTSSSTKEHEILVFSIMAEIFKHNLIDPLDKPAPSRIKTCFKVIQILHSYFKQTTNTVQQACARVMIDLGKHVLGAESPQPAPDTQTFVTLLFSPLASILKSGVDKASQSTASVCINQQIQYWKAHLNIPKYRQMLDQVCPELLAVSLKLNCEYHEIFMALQTVIGLKGLEFFNSKLQQFVSKILGVINKINSQKSPQDSSNFNTYMCKVHVCGILAKIGELVKDKPPLKVKLDELDVLPSLEKATRNRVIQVQMAAAKAIRSWNGEPENEVKDRRASSTPKTSNKGQIISLEEARNNKKRERSGSKQQKLKLEKELNHIQQDLHKLVKGGWGPHTRANNYVKKNTGVGGGYCSKMEESPSPKLNKSHKQHIDELRKYIKQSSKEHGKKDKFVFYEHKPTNEHSPKALRTDMNSNLPIASRKKINNQQNQMQFVLDQNQGDQHVNLPSDQSYKNPYAQSGFSGRFDTQDKEWLSKNKQALQQMNSQNLQGIIDEQEIKQLLNQQKKMLDLQPKQSNQFLRKNHLDQALIKQEKAQPGEMTFNESQQEKKKNIPGNKGKYSSRQPKEASEQTKGRQVLYQEKLLNNKQENLQMNKIKKFNDDSFKQKQKSAFKVRETPEDAEVSLDSASDEISKSIAIAEILNQSDFQGLGWNPFRPSDMKIVESFKPEQDKQFGKGKVIQRLSEVRGKSKEDQIKDSLVLSLSREEQSRSRSPPKISTLTSPPLTKTEKSQFTLNPKPEERKNMIKKKFDSFSQMNNQQEEEQILDESKYEESVPYLKAPRPAGGQNIKEYYKIAMKHGDQLEKQKKKALSHERKSQVYQQMIKNPPKAHGHHRLDKASELHPQESSREQSSEIEQVGENITDTWEKVLELLQNNEVNQAYSSTLALDDPIYLLRLMLITQTPLRKLTPANTCKLWQKFLEIYQHRFIDNIFLQIFTSAQKLGGGKGLGRSLSIEQTNQLLIELYELSGRTKGKLSFQAASLYNQIEQGTNNRNQSN